MKKITKFLSVLFLTGVTSTFTSCSSDDGGGDTSGDPLIGKWKMTERLEGGVSTFDDCAAQNIYEFKADGAMTANDFEDGGSGCEDQVPAGIDFTWENLGDNSYKYTIPLVGFEFEFETEFSNSNNTLIVSGIDGGELQETHFIRQ